ncbi:hypothetical protein AGMMS49574_03330 [Bacteroidia bacterium]|nr:hypothetical protein AGMMS49574_03330 [Bacteroidia bacterium]GHU56243.1 hypothetical protein FACS189411_06410 [Bacteroidia bacterium]
MFASLLRDKEFELRRIIIDYESVIILSLFGKSPIFKQLKDDRDNAHVHFEYSCFNEVVYIQ